MIFAVLFVFWLLYVEYRISAGRHTPALYFLLLMAPLMILCSILAGIVPFSMAGFFYIDIIVGAFWIGHLAGALVFRDQTQTAGSGCAPAIDLIAIISRDPVLWCLKRMIIVGSVAGVVAMVALWEGATAVGIKITSFADLAKLPAYYSAMRYMPGAQDAEPVLVRFCMPLLEAAASAAGLLLLVRTSARKRAVQSMPLVIAFLMTLMTGVRSYFLLNIVWYAGSLIAVLCVGGQVFTQLRSFWFWIKAGSIIGTGFLFGSAFQLLRSAAASAIPFTFNTFMSQWIPAMADSVAAMVLGTLVFDKVILPGTPLHFAAHSFGPVLAWFGLEAIRYPPAIAVANGMSDSNQYSLIGFLLLDFGPILAALIYALTGFLAAATVRLVRSGVIAALPFLIAIICVELFTPINNFFFFTTHVALFMVMTGMWSVLQRLAPASPALEP